MMTLSMSDVGLKKYMIVTLLGPAQGYYSGGHINSVKTLGANISINKACNPFNLGAKLKLLFSSLKNCP